MRTLILTLSMLLFATAIVAAETWTLVGAVVQIGGKQLTGYLSLNNLPSGDLRQAAAKATNSTLLFTPDVVEIQFPFKAFVSTSTGTQDLELASVTRITRKPSPFDGEKTISGVVAVTAHQAKLLKGKPVYACAATFDNGATNWVSYDEKVGKGQLETICKQEEECEAKGDDDEEKIELKQRETRLLKNKNIFSISLPDE